MSDAVDPKIAKAMEALSAMTGADAGVVTPAPPSLFPAEVAEFQRHHARAVDLLADAAWLDRLRSALVQFAAELATVGAVAAGVPAPVAALLVGAVSSVADAVVAEALSPAAPPPPAPRA